MQEPYIIKFGDKYSLKIANNLYASPCQCKQRVEWAKTVHFHHLSQGAWNPKGEMRTYLVEKDKEYTEG
jgi:hypothetical protein